MLVTSCWCLTENWDALFNNISIINIIYMFFSSLTMAFRWTASASCVVFSLEYLHNTYAPFPHLCLPHDILKTFITPFVSVSDILSKMLHFKLLYFGLLGFSHFPARRIPGFGRRVPSIICLLWVQRNCLSCIVLTSEDELLAPDAPFLRIWQWELRGNGATLFRFCSDCVPKS